MHVGSAAVFGCPLQRSRPRRYVVADSSITEFLAPRRRDVGSRRCRQIFRMEIPRGSRAAPADSDFPARGHRDSRASVCSTGCSLIDSLPHPPAQLIAIEGFCPHGFAQQSWLVIPREFGDLRVG